ncbi:MAG: hypothetical protein II688_04965, partial [Lachnospiraceae bacterium]|nr:hypothetical protein [Lachnospiraceae bacterium]
MIYISLRDDVTGTIHVWCSEIVENLMCIDHAYRFAAAKADEIIDDLHPVVAVPPVCPRYDRIGILICIEIEDIQNVVSVIFFQDL